MKLLGKRVIITGANQGFGLAVAKKFLTEGADITICARNKILLKEAHQILQASANNFSKIFSIGIDVAKPTEVDQLVDYAMTKMGGVDVLIANAGVYGTKGPLEKVDWEEWSAAIDINLKGTVLPCRSVLRHLKKQCSGKIIILSGGGATKPMPYLSAYAVSKAAIVRFAETLAEETAEFHIDVNAIAPGGLNTRLLDEILAAGPEKVGQSFYEQSLKQKEQGGAPLEIGASLCVFLASSESDGITGKLISAVWDPWKNLINYRNELMNSDIYTLRRIVPEDRGQVWENQA